MILKGARTVRLKLAMPRGWADLVRVHILSKLTTQTWCLTSTETTRLIRDRGVEVGEEGDHIHCHHQNDFCIKTGSDKSHFNVSLIVRDKVTRVSTDHNF